MEGRGGREEGGGGAHVLKRVSSQTKLLLKHAKDSVRSAWSPWQGVNVLPHEALQVTKFAAVA